MVVADLWRRLGRAPFQCANGGHVDYPLDRDGAQIGHKMLLIQWQDGKKVSVWPEELAPNKPRFPTPPWSQRS